MYIQTRIYNYMHIYMRAHHPAVHPRPPENPRKTNRNFHSYKNLQSCTEDMADHQRGLDGLFHSL